MFKIHPLLSGLALPGQIFKASEASTSPRSAWSVLHKFVTGRLHERRSSLTSRSSGEE
jgi:hypothetical protein